jgi:hypothetical protein
MSTHNTTSDTHTKEEHRADEKAKIAQHKADDASATAKHRADEKHVVSLCVYMYRIQVLDLI